MVAYSPWRRGPSCQNPFRQRPCKAHHASGLEVSLFSPTLHVPGGCLIRNDGHELEKGFTQNVQDHMPGFVVSRLPDLWDSLSVHSRPRTRLPIKDSSIQRFTPTDDAVTKAKDLTVSRFLQGETDPGRLVKCQDPGAGKE